MQDTMKVTANTAVTLRYKVSDAVTHKLIDEGRDPMVYLHGGYENTFPKIEAALDGQEVGFQTTLNLQPEDAFGARDESLVRTIPKSEFPPGVKVGGQLEGRNDRGEPQHFRDEDQGPPGDPRRQPPARGQGAEVQRDRRALRDRGRDRPPPCARRARAPPLGH